MPLDLAVLVSGGGSNLQSIIDATEKGLLDARIRLVVSNNPDAYGLIRAMNHNIPQQVIEHRDYDSRAAFDQEMIRAIKESGATTVAMAGFMRMVTPAFLEAFPGHVVNIHPALLPSFPGVHGQADAANYGVRFSGCTVHLVDEKMDHGPIIIQAVVPAYETDDGDSLGARILKLEHRIYPQALSWFAQGRIRVKERKIEIVDGEPFTSYHGPEGPFMVSPGLEPGF